MSLSEGVYNSTLAGNLSSYNLMVGGNRMEWGAPSVMSMVIFTLTVLLGVPGNGAVIRVTGCKMKSKAHTVCFLNLAVADITFCLFLPFLIIDNSEHHSWYIHFPWVLLTPIMFLNGFASIYMLCLISIYRCLAITRPIWFQQHLSLAWVRATCFVVWLIAIAMLLVPLYTEYFSNCVLIWTVFIFGLPFIIMITCYTLAGWRLHGDRLLKSRKPIRLIVTAVAAFVTCWLPITLYVLLLTFARGVAPDWLKFTVALASLNSALNPLIYVIASSNFRQVFRRSPFASLQLAFSEDELQGETPNRNPTSDRNV
ncbi:C3a anaphylatoxin chemotactic receptor-like [Hemitrygon akajei]|uniref:C3a anaphylatoxin chemotactic receptor-like n=1 Tax=Hemitrygon akajei TaxID=2704970 RepID=UPI003BF98432